MRACAALVVLVSHVYDFTYFPSTYTSVAGHLAIAASWGVFVFFALSGYLIFLPFARHWWGSRPPLSYSRYVANRALRILPIYYVVLIAYTAWHRDGGQWSQLGRFAVFWQNYSIYTIYRVDGPMWSLVNEVQFYLLLPLLAFGLGVVTRRSRTGAVVGLLLIAVGSGGARLWFWLATSNTSTLVQFHQPHWYPWIVSLPLTLVFFVPGMLLAMMRVAWDERRPRWASGWLGRGEVWFVAGLVVLAIGCISSRIQVAQLVAAIGAFGLVGACVLPFDTAPRLGFLDWRWLASIGLASYSVYLVHQPIVELLVAASWYPNGFVAVLVGALAITLALAAIGYLLVERPFLSLRRGWSPGRAAQ